MSDMKVPFFDYQGLYTPNKPEDAELNEIMQGVMKRGAFILQREVAEFEHNLKEYLGVKYAFAVANGTDGLIIALRAAGIGPGDEVIFPSHTYVATAAAVHFVGATPIPIESGDDHLIDHKAIEPSITNRTRAIMPVQLNGRTCKMDLVQEIADRHNLKIIEDAAQGLGSKYKGQFAGTFGLAGMFSFYPAKILGCFGDGGAVVTNDPKMAEQIALLRDHGRNDKGEIVAWGLNSRLDNLQAAILNYKFKSFNTVVAKRRDLASLYNKNLSDLNELKLPAAPDTDSDHFDTFQNYEIEAKNRDDLHKFMIEAGIGSLKQWGGKAVHEIDSLGIRRSLPFTEGLTSRMLMLPMNPMLSNRDVQLVCDTIRQFYKG